MFRKTQRAASPSRWAQLLLIVAACAFLLGAGDDVNSRFNDLGHKLMCRCGCNQVLLECNHVGCQYSERMRGELMTALQRGDSDDLVLQAFVQKYGTTVLAAPTTTGFNRIAWIMPFVALALGLTLVVVVVRAWNRRLEAAAPPPAAAPPELDAYRERARQETEL